MAGIAQWFTGVTPPTIDYTNPLAGSNGQGGTANGGFATTNYQQAIQQAMQQALGGNAQGNATAAGQQNLVQMLQGLANGSGPSLAQGMLNRATQGNVNQAAGQVGSLRGINPGAQALAIANNTANLNQQAAAQASQQRSAEQLAATGQLNSALGTERSQDIGQQQANTALAGTFGTAQNEQNQIAAELQKLQQGTAAGNAQLDVNAQSANAALGGQQLGLLASLISSGATGLALPGGGGNAPTSNIPGSSSFVGPTASSSSALSPTPNQSDYGPPQPTAPYSSSYGPPQPTPSYKPPDYGSYARGGVLPGIAPYAGDTTRNDNLVIRASPGEEMMPRTDVAKAREFLRAVGAQRNTSIGPVKQALRVAMAKQKQKA